MDELGDGITSLLLFGKEQAAEKKYTIIIPTYKRGKLIRRSLESAINQTYDDYEIVVVDNDDDFDNIEVRTIIEGYCSSKIRYYKNKSNLGAEGNFNRGLELAQGKYVTWLHDDDFLELDFLEVIDKYINGKRAVFGGYKTVNEAFAKIENADTKKSGIIKKSLKLALKVLYKLNPLKGKINKLDIFVALCPIGVIGAVYSKEGIEAVGGFNRDFYPGTDYELNYRYVEKFGAVCTKKKLSNYVIGENDSVSASKLFAKFNYELRKKMIADGVIKDTKANSAMLRYLYYRDVDTVLHCWNNESILHTDKIDELGKLKTKIITTKLYVKRKIKLGE